MRVYLYEGRYSFDYECDDEDLLFETNKEIFIGALIKYKNKMYVTRMIDFKNNFCVIKSIKIETDPEETNDQIIVCPYCGYGEIDSWEASDSDDNHQCGNCASIFAYKRIVDITYSASPVKLNEDVIFID